MMYQWTDGEVSHVVKLALESVRSAIPSLTASHRSRLVEALAGALAASAWHAHAVEIDVTGFDASEFDASEFDASDLAPSDLAAIDARARLPWRTIASDPQHDWSEFCPLDVYGGKLWSMLQSVCASGSAVEQVVHRACQLASGSSPRVDEPINSDEPTGDELIGDELTSEQAMADELMSDLLLSDQVIGGYYGLAWLAVQPEGACVCVEFLKRVSDGPFSVRDEALVRILSTELLAEPAGQASQSEWPPMVELAELPRRQREVLTGLLAGWSVKEIASELGISPYTVNDYIKALYRRYQVSSRGELLAAMHGLRRPAVPK